MASCALSAAAINMATGELAGAEALRMRMPDGSYGLSEEFIASAEEIGVISALGRWVFEEACRIIAGWQRHGINLPLSVNISAVQLRDASVVSHLQGCWSATALRRVTSCWRSPKPRRLAMLNRRWRCCARCSKPGWRSRWMISAWATPTSTTCISSKRCRSIS